MGISFSTYGPTLTHRKSLSIAKEESEEVRKNLEIIGNKKVPELLKDLNEAGTPWLEGMPISGK